MASAQADFSLDDGLVSLTAPPQWTLISQNEKRLEWRSSEAELATNADVGRLIVEILPLQAPYGQLRAGDEVAAYLEILRASLPFSGDFRPQHFSELARWRQGDFSAAGFLAYAEADQNQTAYYARWLAYALEPSSDPLSEGAQVVLIQQAVTLPPNSAPSSPILSLFDAQLETISIAGEALEGRRAALAFDRLTDPLSLIGPAVAALGLPNGFEARMAAPPNWSRRDVTRSADYPATYLLEGNPLNLQEGAALSGAVLAFNLISPKRLVTLLDLENEAELPAFRDLSLAYLNAVLTPVFESLSLGQPLDFDWTEAYYAVLIPITYPSGMVAQWLVIEDAGGRGLVSVILYAPSQADFVMLGAIWAEMLRSLTLNGVALPFEPLQAALEALSWTE